MIKDDYLLTFDDGPSEISRDLIIELNKYHKKAMFFLLGEKLSSYDLEIYNNFEIGCHGFSHINFALLGPYRTYIEFHKSIDAFRRNGLKPKYFRAPYGLYNLTLLLLIKKEKMKPFQWDYLLGDWVVEKDGVLYSKLKNKAKDKNVLVLHDGKEGKADFNAKNKMLKELVIFLDEERKKQKDYI